jgi:hypothetical protein
MLAQNLRNLMCRRVLLSRETASARNRGDQPKGASRVGTTRWRRAARTDVVGNWLIYIDLKGREGQESNRLILHENGKETKIGRCHLVEQQRRVAIRLPAYAATKGGQGNRLCTSTSLLRDAGALTVSCCNTRPVVR